MAVNFLQLYQYDSLIRISWYFFLYFNFKSRSSSKNCRNSFFPLAGKEKVFRLSGFGLFFQNEHSRRSRMSTQSEPYEEVSGKIRIVNQVEHLSSFENFRDFLFFAVSPASHLVPTDFSWVMMK